MKRWMISVAKYMCLCGFEFKKKDDAERHVETSRNLGLENHFVITKLWRARLLEWFLNLPGRRIARYTGVYLVYIVLIKHFHVEWSMLESCVMGIGLGLAIE